MTETKTIAVTWTTARDPECLYFSYQSSDRARVSPTVMTGWVLDRLGACGLLSWRITGDVLYYGGWNTVRLQSEIQPPPSVRAITSAALHLSDEINTYWSGDDPDTDKEPPWRVDTRHF